MPDLYSDNAMILGVIFAIPAIEFIANGGSIVETIIVGAIFAGALVLINRQRR